MTPFNHELARNGHPCQTRSGKEVKQLTWFAEAGKWAGVVDGELEWWYEDGRYRQRPGMMDLVMTDALINELNKEKQ